MASDKDIIADAKEQFSKAEAAEALNRTEALDDIRFARLAEQWPLTIRQQREQEGRPCLTINRLPSFIRQVVNDARMNRPSVRVRPVDSGADIKTAQIYDGLIRNIETTSNAPVAYDTAVDFAVTMGFGYWRVDVDYAHDDSFDLDIVIKRIANPFTVYGDAGSQAADASDWNYGFVTELIPETEFKQKYKGAAPIDWQATRDARDTLWYDADHVRVAEWWTREEVMRPIVKLNNGQVIEAKQYEKNIALFQAAGIQVVGEREARSYKVTHRLMTANEVLETNEWAGKYIPIIPVYGDEINVEGKRYWRSLIRDAKDAQRMFNYWRTNATELVALAPKTPFIGPKGAFKTDIGKWQTANVKAHAFIEYDGPTPPQRQPYAGVPAGALQEAMNASDDMKSIMGLYDASLGARSNETSGKAILARQREGDTATFHFIDNLNRAIQYSGRVLVDLIPEVYSEERIVRILHEDGKAENVTINGQGQKDDGSTYIYELARGKYDVTVESGPSFNTKREEMAQMLTEIMRANPAVAPLVMDKWVKNMDWPEAETLAQRFRATMPPQILAAENAAKQGSVEVLAQQLAQAQGQLQQMQQAMQQMSQDPKRQADIERAKLDIAKAQREAQTEEHRMALEARKTALEAQAAEQDAAIKMMGLEVQKKALEVKALELAISERELQLRGHQVEAEHSARARSMHLDAVQDAKQYAELEKQEETAEGGSEQ